MKKGTKIALIIAAVTAVGACAGIAFAVKQYTQNNFESIDMTPDPFPYESCTVPADYVPYTVAGVTLMMPADAEPRDDDPESIKNRVYECESMPGFRVFVSTPSAYGEVDLVHSKNPFYNLTMQEEARAILGRKLDNWFDFYDLMLHMTAKDSPLCNPLRTLRYYQLAYLKEEAVLFYQETWDKEWDTAHGWVNQIGKPEDESDSQGYSFMVNLFPNSDLNSNQLIIVRCQDAETCGGIVNSISVT